jgi:hypothetical protein
MKEDGWKGRRGEGYILLVVALLVAEVWTLCMTGRSPLGPHAKDVITSIRQRGNSIARSVNQTDEGKPG